MIRARVGTAIKTAWRGRPRSPRPLSLFVLAVLGCGGPNVPAEGAPITIEGRVTYEARHPTATGASEALETRNARHLELALVGADGSILAEGRADADGQFRLTGPSSARALRVFARARTNGHDVAIARDPMGRQTHFFDVPLGGGAPLAAHASEASANAGSIHMLDTLLRGLEAVHAWSGRELPPLFAYWVRGGTREWSYYRGERPEGSGRYALELLGGDPGQQSISDTDEHDEAIILHELGHFVLDRLSTDSSSGGHHPRGVLVDPGLAWEEGRATWLALAVQRDPLYRDTIGLEPWGRLRVDEDMERHDWGLPGLGSEASVCRILWDLSDGAGDQPDRDGDGVAIGPAPLLEAMIELREVEGAYPALSSFLRHLIESGRISRADLQSMLQRTGEPASLIDAVWPIELAVGATLNGTIDGVTDPAPSGGQNLPTTGFDANHTYRVRVERAGLLRVRLRIAGSGQPGDHTDLDLELRDLRARLLASSAGTAATETASHFVQPGWYIVRVRDGGGGNRAAYSIEAALESL